MNKYIYGIVIFIICLLGGIFIYDQYQEKQRKSNILYTQAYLDKQFAEYETDDLMMLQQAIELNNNGKYKESFDILMKCGDGDMFIRNIKAILLTNIYLEDEKICSQEFVVEKVNSMEYEETKVILLNLLKGVKIKEDKTILHTLLNNRGNINVVQ